LIFFAQVLALTSLEPATGAEVMILS